MSLAYIVAPPYGKLLQIFSFFFSSCAAFHWSMQYDSSSAWKVKIKNKKADKNCYNLKKKKRIQGNYFKYVSAGKPVLDCNWYRDKWSGGLRVSTVSVLAVASPSLIRASGVVICATRTGGLSLSQQRTVRFYCTSDSNRGGGSNFHALLSAGRSTSSQRCQLKSTRWGDPHPVTETHSHSPSPIKLKSRIVRHGARYNQ